MELKEYKAVLEQCVRAAHEAQNTITEEVYASYFAALNLTEEQDRLTRGYLKGLHIEFSDGKRKKRKKDWLNSEDYGYLKLYLEELKGLPKLGSEEVMEASRLAMEDDKEAKQKLIYHYLKSVVDIAKLYVYHGMRLEDLIGEGNIGLMTAVDMLGALEGPEEVEGFIGKIIMDSMDAAIAADNEDKLKMSEILERLSKISEAAKSLSEDLRRLVTPEELSRESEFSAEEIWDAMELTGDSIEGLTRSEKL